jgi:hypothetical protein
MDPDPPDFLKARIQIRQANAMYKKYNNIFLILKNILKVKNQNHESQH